MTASRRVIINADDFGLSSGVNEAVAEAHERGILSSATIMANMPAFEEAARIAKAHPQLGVGIHFNLLRGRPLSGRVPSLVGPDGAFLESALAIWRRALLGGLSGEEIEEELAAQAERAKASGIAPTHADSEKHLHLLIPEIGGAACRVAKRFGIRAIRVVREGSWRAPGLPRPFAAQRCKRILLNWRGKVFALRALKHGLLFPDRFFGVAFAGRMTPELYHALFAALPEGTTEIMCHPATSALASEGARSPSWLDRHRPGEYRALLDPAVREALEKNGARLVTYADI